MARTVQFTILAVQQWSVCVCLVCSASLVLSMTDCHWPSVSVCVHHPSRSALAFGSCNTRALLKSQWRSEKGITKRWQQCRRLSHIAPTVTNDNHLFSRERKRKTKEHQFSHGSSRIDGQMLTLIKTITCLEMKTNHLPLCCSALRTATYTDLN